MGEQISLATSITAGLPVFYQIDWGDGTVDTYHENSNYKFFNNMHGNLIIHKQNFHPPVQQAKKICLLAYFYYQM